jgi:hypothetical protein
MHPFIARMQAAILEVEERFMAQRGLPSPKLVQVETQAPTMREALASESKALPRWKRRPDSFVTLETGEVIHFGPGRTHTMRTYVRPNYTQADVAYLEQVVVASRVIVAEEADRILRTMKPDTSRSKRRPAEAEADPDMRMEYRQREPRSLTPEDLIRSQFSGRALAKELRRIGRTL